MKLRTAEIHYGWLERFAMRMLFALVVERHIPDSLSHLAISAPHGFAQLFDLRFLLEPSVFRFCRYLLWAALILYVLRLAWSLVLPYMMLLSIAVGTVINSRGAIAHYLQIVSLVLCAQTAAHFYGLYRARRQPEATPAEGESRLIFWSQQTIVATYLVSGLTKLLHTSGLWFVQSPLIAVEIIKTTEQNYFNRLDAGTCGASLAIAEWMVRHPLATGLALGMGLLLELTSPLALLGRQWAAVFGIGLLIFHETVDRIMKLQFDYNEFLLWIFFVNVPFWAVWAARAGRARFHNMIVPEIRNR